MISGKYKYLVTTRALDEGLTIPNVEQIIITAGSINPIQQSQRTARGKTIDNKNINKQTKIFNLYFDDFYTLSGQYIKSRDKQKLLDRQSSNVYFINSLNDIS